MEEQQLLQQFQSKETITFAFEAFVAQMRPHIEIKDAKRLNRGPNCKESRQLVKYKLNKLCCHVLEDIYMPNVLRVSHHTSEKTQNMVQDAVFSAKVAQQLLQMHGESLANDNSIEYFNQLISAVCIGLFLLIQCEDKLNLKDLIIEKMLYQVNKVCFERAKVSSIYPNVQIMT